METNRELVESLQQAERAAAAPYIDYPPTPAWYPPATGVWAAAFCLTFLVPDDSPVRGLLLALLVVAELGFVTWYRRYRGVWPRGKAPAEISRVMRLFIVGAVAVIGVVGLAIWLTTPWIAAVVALAVVTPSIAWYETAYSNAAARARARLS